MQMIKDHLNNDFNMTEELSIQEDQQQLVNDSQDESPFKENFCNLTLSGTDTKMERQSGIDKDR